MSISYNNPIKRSSFFKVSSLLLSAFTVPLGMLANTVRNFRENKGIKVEAGKDRFDASITLMEGDMFFTKVSTKDTDGDLFAFESTRFVPGGPPLHYHYAQDEWFYILEGDFLFKIGEQTFTAKAGDSIFGPRMVPHAFSKLGQSKARMMITYQPAGKMEQHFKEVSQGLYKNMTEAEKQKIRQEHGFEVVGPALVHEK